MFQNVPIRSKDLGLTPNPGPWNWAILKVPLVHILDRFLDLKKGSQLLRVSIFLYRTVQNIF